MSVTRQCDGCDAVFTLKKHGHRRRWCSDRCRKRTLYSGTCEVCGAATDGGGGAAAAPTRCSTHAVAARAAALSEALGVKYAPRRDALAALYREGLPLAEIGERLGISTGAVHAGVFALRNRYGYDLPYRYAGCRERGGLS